MGLRRSITTLLMAIAYSVAAHSAPVKPVVLAISEGTSGGIDNAAAQVKYKGLADLIGKTLQKPVSVVFVREFSDLDQGMKEQRFDIVMARPSDYPARGVRQYGYYFIATAEPSGHCALIVSANSPLKSVKELQGKYFALPERQAYMTHFCTAALRDEGIRLESSHVYYVREQNAIPFALDNKMADVGGVASYSGVYRKLRQSGKRLLYESVAQPYFPVIASRSLSPAERQSLQALLVNLKSMPDGQPELDRLAITGFVTTEQAKFNKLLDWLGTN
jgi:ABC-type phosphate/phosphonate transport system substrate-binding protein